MNNPWGKDLQGIKKYFEAPEPVRKQEFLERAAKQAFIRNKISLLYMLWIQFSYISKLLWVFSAGIFAGAFIASRYIDSGIIWCLSAAVPFIVTFSLSASLRSVIYGMQEFEMSSRFTLKSVIMSRITILGTINISMLLITAFLSGNGMWRNALYMLAPYLLSAIGGFIILRKFPSREGIGLSGSFCVVISLIDMESINSYSFIYEARYTGIWIIIIIALFIIAGYESLKMADTIGGRTGYKQGI